MPNGRCVKHGGKSLSGLASPTFKTGRYSKVLPVRLAARFQAALDDPDLLNLTSEIALVQARIEEQIGRLDSGESGAVWRDLRATWRAVDKAKDKEERAELLEKVDSLINRGYGDHAVFSELGTNLELLRRLTESRRKHLIEMETLVNADEFGLFLSALRDSLLRNIQDRKILAAIQRDITDLLTRHDKRLQPADHETLSTHQE